MFMIVCILPDEKTKYDSDLIFTNPPSISVHVPKNNKNYDFLKENPTLKKFAYSTHTFHRKASNLLNHTIINCIKNSRTIWYANNQYQKLSIFFTFTLLNLSYMDFTAKARNFFCS